MAIMSPHMENTLHRQVLIPHRDESHSVGDLVENAAHYPLNYQEENSRCDQDTSALFVPRDAKPVESKTACSAFVPHGNSALSTYRAEVLQAAQRRDATRLRSMVSTLTRQKHLTSKELDSCFALHHVVWTEELNDTAQLLISYGCDPYYADIHGDTVFHYTARGCNLGLLRYLFQLYGHSILEVLNNNHLNVFLTVASESSSEKCYQTLNLLEWLYLNGCSLETQDAHGRTGLMWACQRGSLAVVQWFLSRGANLSHRDHNGRTVLQVACLSGDEETIRAICQVGAINLLDCESIDDPGCNTALKICWHRGYFFLAFSLRQWHLQKRLFGVMQLFRSPYAFYYWILTGSNFIIFLSIARTLVHHDYEYWYHCFIFLFLYATTQAFWLIAYKADPGYVKSHVIPDQSYRCTPNFRFNLLQRPVFGYRVTSACYKLQMFERNLAWMNAELTSLNRHFGVRYDLSVKLPADAERKFQECVHNIQMIRKQIFTLMEKVGHERRAACPTGYAKQVLEGSSTHLCITCRVVMPFRAHHCGDCAHCIHRFDHHCIWVDNCIGIGNQRSFFLFLSLLACCIGYFWYLVGVYYTTHLMKDPQDRLDLFIEPLFYIALTNSLCNLLWGGFVGYLLGRTLKSMCTNLTFYEYLKKPPYVHQRYKSQVYTFLWDLQGLTLIKILRNIFSFWFLDNWWDKNDFPKCFPEAFSANNNLYNAFLTQPYHHDSHPSLQLSHLPHPSHNHLAPDNCFLHPYNASYVSLRSEHNGSLTCPHPVSQEKSLPQRSAGPVTSKKEYETKRPRDASRSPRIMLQYPLSTTLTQQQTTRTPLIANRH